MENNTQIEIIEDTAPAISKAEAEEETVLAEEISEEESISEDAAPKPVFDTDDFARQLLEVYPNADVSDARLLELAQGRVAPTPVEIYRAVNFDRLVEDAVKEASKAAEARLIGHIRTSGMRPCENGTDRQREGKKTPPVTRLSRAERARIAARAGRGERIEF